MNKNESAWMSMGHHSHQDGISQFQSFFAASDNSTGEYPFMKRPYPTFWQWYLIYISLPISWYLCLQYYMQHSHDVNCIKKHPSYLSGKMNAALSHQISMEKAKKVAKSMHLTFNDLILGIISKALK